MKLDLITIGSDPEFFIKNKKTGKFVPSSYITSAVKDDPQHIVDEFYIHKDNLTVEGNIPPAKTKEEFVANMKFIKEYINTLAEIKDCELVSDNVGEFSKRYINSEDGNEFGCNSFLNGWDSSRAKVNNIKSNNRFAGFHIHYGFKVSPCITHRTYTTISRAFDIFLTYPSRLIYETPERDDKYGKYGSYRTTSYGMECRSLGGFFTQDKYLEWIWDQSVKMFNWLNEKDNIRLINNISWSHNIESTISTFIKQHNMESLIFDKKEEIANV